MAVSTWNNESTFLSIAIPVYNQVETIESTINSVLDALQDEPDVEIVISDNLSTDGTAEVVASFGDKIKVVHPESHLSMAANWNFAVRACTGKWIGMLSGDDRVLNGYVSSIREIVSKCESAVFAYGGWMVVDAASGGKRKRTALSMPSVSKPRFTAASLLQGPKASFASYCFLRSAFDKAQGFPECYNLIQDWVLQFKLSLVGDFVKTNKVISEYLSGQRRDELEFRRVLPYVADLVTFCSGDIWQSCEVGVSRSSVLRACEIHAVRAQRLLNRFPALKDEGDSMLAPLYAIIGKERVKRIDENHFSLSSRAFLSSKRAVRKIAQTLF